MGCDVRAHPLVVALLSDPTHYGMLCRTVRYVERRAYLASCLGFSAVAMALQRLASQFWSRGVSGHPGHKELHTQPLRTAFIVLVLAAYAYTSVQRVEVFSSPVSVWQDVCRQYPHSVRGLNNLATALLREGR